MFFATFAPLLRSLRLKALPQMSWTTSARVFAAVVTLGILSGITITLVYDFCGTASLHSSDRDGVFSDVNLFFDLGDHRSRFILDFNGKDAIDLLRAFQCFPDLFELLVG